VTDPPTLRFRAEILTSGGQATGIPVPEEVLDGLGAGRRVPVVVTIGGHSYRSTVSPYQGRIMVPLSAENRTAAGVAAGEEVEVALTRDDAPREVEVPEDLQAAVAADETAAAFFAALAPSHKKAYATWITDAKKPETRASRVESAVGMLREGKRR
jgi:Bacteriocin-protection, YdeI or OmpD-Associated/Domain of unknown function (DUF1905)